MKANGNGTAGSEVLLEALAYKLGQDAFERAQEEAGQVIACEKRRREKFNQPEIASQRARYNCLLERRKEFKDFLRLAGPQGFSCTRGQAWYYWVIASVLVAAGIFFAHLTLAPFGLGWEALALSLGIGIVSAVLTDLTLEKTNSEALIRCICLVALAGSLAGILLMAILRGDLLALYLKTATGVTDELQNAASASEFYKQAILKLQLSMGFLAVAMELASGMAIFEARKVGFTTHEQVIEARKGLEEVEDKLIAIIGRVTHLVNEPGMNEDQFHRDFYLGLLERAKRNGLVQILFIGGLLLSLCFVPAARAQTVGGSKSAADTNVVIALDLTQSVGSKGYDGRTEYDRNLEGACQLISQLPPGTRVTVLGITDESFSRPYVLLSRDVPRDKGPLQFQDRIAIAKSQVIAELRRSLRSSPPKFRHTDVFGALIVGADVLTQSKGRKVLVLFSDMRQFTEDLDLERPRTIAGAQSLTAVANHRLIADLRGIEIYALGVDGAGKSVAYWESLHEFWARYFERSGGRLKAYAMTRDLEFAGHN